MRDAQGQWRTIEHTADLAMEVEADSLEQTFAAAAHGTAGVVMGSEAGTLTSEREAVEVWRELSIEAPDLEALLVDWLREILHIQESEGLLLVAAEVLELDDRKLFGRAGFKRMTGLDGVERELKGVTYHDLEVKHRAGGWYARVVFDV